MARDISRVTLTCRLTRDVELRHTPSGTAVADLRVAWTTSRKDSTGEWIDHSNYGDVTVWGRTAEICAEWLSKGRQIGVDGRLEFEEWEGQDGSKRSKLKVVADNIAFLGSRDDREGGGDSGGFEYAGGGGSSGEMPDFVPETPNSDDDIPF
jgi:single-strand DNA-binding protein